MDEDIILQYRDLVYALSKKFYSVEREDLIQAGFLGLKKAYINYDGTSGTKFSSYAYQYIYGEMYDTVNKNRNIKLQKDALGMYKKVVRTRELLEQKYKRSVSIKETAYFLNLDVNVVERIFQSLSASLDIDTVVKPVSKVEQIDDLIMLRDSLEQLSDSERKIIEARYLQDLTQSETAKVFKMSQAKISRLEASGKEKMKNFMAA